MINYQEFEEKVKSMTDYDIIMAMVNGLRKPLTEIDMDDFGYVEDGICYGNAAINAILHIMGITSKEEAVDLIIYMPDFSDRFKIAIDYLSCGGVDEYNNHVKDYGLSQIAPMPGLELPCLGNDYTEEQLQQYEKLAEYQLTVKQ